MGGGGGGGGGGARGPQQPQPSRQEPPYIPNQRQPPPPIPTSVRDSMSEQGTPFRPGNNTAPPPSRPDLNAARGSQQQQQQPITVSKRPDMRGPTDISNILSGLKTKPVNPPVSTESVTTLEDKSSTISISELKDLQNDNLPHKSKRRQKSDKNTISLALDV